MRHRSRGARATSFRIAEWVIEAEPEPFRQAWMRLSPAQRLARVWKMIRQVRDPEAAHDARSLPFA